jgi:hypothetical protein
LLNTRNDLKSRRGENFVPGARKREFKCRRLKVKEKGINDITTIPAKSWDALARFKALHLTKCFE